jgi:membrane dipeptidase
MQQWEKEHPQPKATLSDVADHIDYLRKVVGVTHVGLGSDFDGIGEPPQGLAGPDRFPALLEELMRRGWTDQEIAQLAGENVLRALAGAEAVAAKLSGEPPSYATIAKPPADAR